MEWIEDLAKTPLPESQFTELPAGLMQIKNYVSFKKSFESFLYQSQELTIYRAPDLNLFSKIGETEDDFRIRMTQAMRENREAKIQKLRETYEEKSAVLNKKLKNAEEKVAAKQNKTIWQMFETIISFCGSILGALMGRGVTKGTINQASSSLKRAGKIGMGNKETSQAKEDLESYQSQLKELEEGFRKETDLIYDSNKIENMQTEKIVITPRKSDISVDKIAILWML